MKKNQLKVAKSTLPGAGNGLFTLNDIRKGEIICEYEGEMITWAEATNRNDKDPHKGGYYYFINDKNVIDAWSYTKTFGRYANDAAGLTRVAGLRNNSTYYEVKKRVYIKATRNIKAGSEIFVSYGQAYWKVMKKELEKMASEKKVK